MQEVRLQLSSEHKTRIRLWVSEDPLVGARIELAHRIGVLTQKTEVVSRFTVKDLSSADFFSEDNGYESIRHRSGWDGDKGTIPLRHWPSQLSTYLNDGSTQFSVALDRSHAVASLSNGTLDVIQHRRGSPFSGTGGTVVLDDTDRILTHTWLGLGALAPTNALRHSNKLRLNHPLVLMFGPGQSSIVDAVKSVPLPSNVYLQTIRATSASSEELMLRVMHLFGKEEQPAAAASVVEVDVGAVMAPFRPTMTAFNETTLSGLIPKSDLQRMVWNTTNPANTSPVPDHATLNGKLSVAPFELRTLLSTEF